MRKAAGTDTLFYLRGIDGAVLAEYGLNGALITRYIYAGGALVAQVAGGATSYYIADHPGSTRRIVTPGGSASTYDYWPFGAVYDQGGPGSRYQFTGLERDAESALIHTPARLYDPYAGRFLQGDPLAALSPERSPYHYARNDPLGYVDPMGLKEKPPKGSFENPYELPETVVEADRSYIEALINPVQGGYDPGRDPFESFPKPKMTVEQFEQAVRDYIEQGYIASKGEPVVVVSTASIIGVPVANPRLFELMRQFVPWAVRYWNRFNQTITRLTTRTYLPTRITVNPSKLAHIFRNAPGHVNPSDAASQKRYIELFEKVASDRANLRTDAVSSRIFPQNAADAGVQAYTKILQSGEQVWVFVLNNQIIDAGINAAGKIR